jgi:dTDP-4-amino-4,6-dideoxygalactose transaminase
MEQVQKFEKAIAEFYNAPYAVATDCCTHAIELCLRLHEPVYVKCPKHTYLSIPMTFNKLKTQWSFNDEKWEDYYFITNTNIIDAAVYWKKNGYIRNTLMCLSFQYKKHLSLGRGGMILTDNKETALQLKKMSYDGRLPDIPWMEQDIDSMGYHYYMTPETAQLGLDKIEVAKTTTPPSWNHTNYLDLSNMKVFNEIK